MTNYDAAIIGGGLSGLIAAVELARANLSVVLLEKSDRLGGRAITVNKNGALFNLGGHALYRGGEAYSALQELGVKLEGGKPPVNGLAIWQNRLLPLPSDLLRLLSSPLLSWSGKIALSRFMLRIGSIRTDSLADVSVREWAEKEIGDPVARHLVYALCRTAAYNNDIDRQSAGAVLRQVRSSLKDGVVYLHGGWQTLVDQLRDMAVRAGATVLSGEKAIEVRHDGDGVRSVHCASGLAFSVRYAISTLAPAETCRLVRNAERTALRRWRDEAVTVKAAVLDLCLKRLPVPGRHFALGIDQPVYYSNHSQVAKLSQGDALVVHLIKYNSTEESNHKADAALLESTMDLLHPQWRGELVAKQFLPNMTVVHDFPRVGKNGDLPGPVPEIRGLYVAGDWSGHGEMLADAAAASARRAVRHLLQTPAFAGKNTPQPISRLG